MRHDRLKCRKVRPVVAQLREARGASDATDESMLVRANALVGKQHCPTITPRPTHRYVPPVLAIRVAVRVHVDAARIARRER